MRPPSGAPPARRPRLCYVTTSSATVHTFLRGLIAAMSATYDVTVVCDDDNPALLAGIEARFVFLRIARPIAPLADASALLRLLLLLRRERFDLVHSIMPKAGLLAMLAARCSGVPVRLHTFSGQVWATRRGAMRALLIGLDRLTARCATLCLVDSLPQRQILRQAGVVRPGAALVLGKGSICGVDTARFHPDPLRRAAVRAALGIAEEAVVILFAGRLNRDKGILELAEAFCRCADADPALHLLIVAAEEEISFDQVAGLCARARARTHLVRFSLQPEHYMMAADIYCLPSHREGMPMSVLEAAACGVPAVVSAIYGTVDSIEGGRTGLFFPVGEVGALQGALATLGADGAQRRALGAAARQRSVALFASTLFERRLGRQYRRLLAAHGAPSGAGRA